MEIKELAKKYENYVVEMRRMFHRMPELSLQEFKTSERIQKELNEIGIPFVRVAKTGIVATIEGGKSGKTIALRADIDALPVRECTGVEYASENDGVMHACGHDGHIAMLLTAGKILKEVQSELQGTVKLFFQPSEENASGAKLMVEEGVMEGVDSVFAIHLWAEIPIGKVSVEAGPRMASGDIFYIRVKGKGGHGSMPNQGVDALVAGAAILLNLQSIASRETSPLEPSVVSVGAFHGGERFNVIADYVEMEGTTRTFSQEIQDRFPVMIDRIAKETAAAYRAEAEVEYIIKSAPVVNDSICSSIAEGSVRKLLGEDGLATFPRMMGGEDFSAYLKQKPGLLAFVGVRNEAKQACYPHHHAKFQIDEDGLLIGASLYVQYALDYLNR